MRVRVGMRKSSLGICENEVDSMVLFDKMTASAEPDTGSEGKR